MSRKFTLDTLVEHVLVNYRWIFVINFLLPLSLVYQVWEFVRNYVVFRWNSAPERHDSKVDKVRDQVLKWRSEGGSRRMCTGRPGWQTMSFRTPKYKSTHFKVHVDLVDVLEVDTVAMTVRAEPLVTMGQLSATLLPLGYSLAVVPELDDLTVGGLVMGTGIESSSHLHGLFQHTCLQYELVLADGSVTTCSKDNNPELFQCVPWSHGTLGFLTAVQIRIIPAKKYVRLQYQSVRGLEEVTRVFNWEACKPHPASFVEGILFSKDHAVIMTGDMVDVPSGHGQVNEIGAWHAPWFFTHVHRAKTGQVEFIPLRQYYHRHTRALFWELQEIIPFGNHPLFRVLLGWLMPPKVSLLKITQPAAVKRLYERCHIIQDMLVPLDSLADAIRTFHQEVEVYPIWLCPFKLPKRPGLLQPADSKAEQQMYVDIGVYGVPKAKNYETVKSTRNIEEFVIKQRGFQMLYADTYTSREEFRNMFDHSLYDKLRQKLDCDKAFPELYDKVKKEARI